MAFKKFGPEITKKFESNLSFYKHDTFSGSLDVL